MTDLDESSFTRLADDTLGRLFEGLEEAVGDRADVELQDGILTVDFEERGRFVVNKHQPNRQIWLASPVSGAAHFAWTGGDWVSTRSGAVLSEVLGADLSQLAGTPIDLST